MIVLLINFFYHFIYTQLVPKLTPLCQLAVGSPRSGSQQGPKFQYKGSFAVSLLLSHHRPLSSTTQPLSPQTTMSLTQSNLVLVTGGAGFVGSEVALEFLRQGQKVRLAFRKPSQVDEWTKRYPEYKKDVSFVIIPDFLKKPGAFDKALEGVTYVAHVAAPINYAPKVSSSPLLYGL